MRAQGRHSSQQILVPKNLTNYRACHLLRCFYNFFYRLYLTCPKRYILVLLRSVNFLDVFPVSYTGFISPVLNDICLCFSLILGDERYSRPVSECLNCPPKERLPLAELFSHRDMTVLSLPISLDSSLPSKCFTDYFL